MAKYSVTTYSVVKGTAEDVVAALETKIEGVDDAKTIRFCKVLETADRKYIGILIYDA